MVITEFQTVINVKYTDGEINIYRDRCFPATKTWLKNWLKLVRQDNREKEILEDLKSYLFNRIQSVREDIRLLANKYSNTHQQYLDMKKIVETKKYPSGVEISEEHLALPTAVLKSLKIDDSNELKELNRLLKTNSKYEDNFYMVLDRLMMLRWE